MPRARRFLAMSWGERGLRARALWTLGWVRVALWLLPFSRVRSLVEGRAARAAGRPAAPWPGPVAVDDAVRSAAAFVPRATCLVRALAGKVLLARAGRRAGLVLGVAKRGAAELEAHAWLECEDGTVVGDRGGPDFAPLPA